MFYEVRPLLISLAKFFCALLWAPEKAKTSLGRCCVTWLHHFVRFQQSRVSKAHSIDMHSPTASSYFLVQHRSHGSWTIHLGVLENPRLSVSLAKSPRLGPNSLSNIITLTNKATPHPSTLPISHVNWKWDRLVLWKKRKKMPKLAWHVWGPRIKLQHWK